MQTAKTFFWKRLFATKNNNHKKIVFLKSPKVKEETRNSSHTSSVHNLGSDLQNLAGKFG